MARQLGHFGFGKRGRLTLAATAVAASFLAAAGTAAADDFPAAPASVTATFTTPGEHPFTVPAGVASVRLRAVGGHGGTAYDASSPFGVAGSPGGEGADVAASFDVAAPITFYAEVGGDGQPNTSTGAGGAGGGGNGGSGVVSRGGGGGGASDVRLCPISGGCDSLSARLLVGAGGGGAGAAVDAGGGSGGLPNGADGQAPPPYRIGHGATVDAGGAGAFGNDGTFGRGADGGGASWFGGGGGGGGYYGGGGGDTAARSTVNAASGGGGGSSYANFGAYDISYAAAEDEPLVSIAYTGVDVPTVSGTARVGMTLHVSWPGHEAGATYRWEDCISPTLCAPLQGATAPDVTVPVVDSSARLRAAVISADGDVVGVSAQTAVVLPADKTAPTIELDAPVDGAIYRSRAAVLASYSCADETGGSGVATCAGPVASGARIDTSTAGDHLFTVTATDAAGNTATRTVHYSVVASGAPVSVSPPTLAGEAQDGQLLTAKPGTWSGSSPVKLAYRWQRCDAAGASCSDISGATSSRYRLTPREIGSTVRLVVTGSNAYGSGTANSVATAVVLAAPPANTALPTIGSVVRKGQLLLKARPGTWHGTPTLAFSYRWQRCDAAGQSCADVPEATGQSYSVPAGQTGLTFRVAVTATNAAGGATAFSAVASA